MLLVTLILAGGLILAVLSPPTLVRTGQIWVVQEFEKCSKWVFGILARRYLVNVQVVSLLGNRKPMMCTRFERFWLPRIPSADK